MGQRVSFLNASGTVRYIGPIDGLGKDNVRLGIEWDNPARGKHDGQYKGKRYFECASFMRTTAIADVPQSFLEAVREKYAPPDPDVPTTEHVISGKVAEEIGFDKIRRQQAQLHRLTVVLVDGLRINTAEKTDSFIKKTCPRVSELDLSRNLFEDFETVLRICGELDSLTTLRINWDFVDNLPVTFPGLKALRLSQNPVHLKTAEHGLPYTPDDPSMITVARIKALEVLDYREILPEYRANAEGFYLSLIAKEIATANEDDVSLVISRHKRYQELCEIHGPPTIDRKSADDINLKFLEARTIKFEFYLHPPVSNEREMSRKTATVLREIPKSFNIYRVKGIVGRIFNHPPLRLKLTWETGIWDPIASYQEETRSSETQYEASEIVHDPESKQGKWMKREVEIKDSTRAIGVCVDGNRAKIRVEPMSLSNSARIV
ncbi:putative Tubulin-specific chaperone E [Glarea lozoyensis 74030]|uniref:Putative Tubulin-specific chaperone E n=1 Tax=Glarea lozoyensis (strain ATCC 74030 / MF5533) TaxID=1104152 RepID=H0EJR4_GLAL7|nr:putative Tubulin-specific chaperone E [Glarea lozoyensis 74030]